jgi:hypothetical protein
MLHRQEPPGAGIRGAGVVPEMINLARTADGASFSDHETGHRVHGPGQRSRVNDLGVGV